MDLVIDKCLGKVKAKNEGTTKWELERIMDSQFKVLLESMLGRSIKPVHMIHLGVVSPSEWFRLNYHRFSLKPNRDREDKLI